MGQNTSSAVMQQRSEAHDSLDDFPTPPWATRALCEFLISPFACLGPLDLLSCREPAANRGHMVRALQGYFGRVEGSDVHDYGAGFPVQDYLFGMPPAPVGFTITNPPYRLAEQFIERMAETSTVGFAVLVRTAFLEGVGRWDRLYGRNPPSYVLPFVERVVMHKGVLSQHGSTATAYCWLLWIEGENDTRVRWIAPCRKQLEKPGDYPAAAA